MTPIDAVRSAVAHYATFHGRARRSELWWFVLALYVALLVLQVALALAHASQGLTLGLLGVVEAAIIVPTLALQVRRLHDTDRSGAWWFMTLVPLVGPILLIVFFATDGTPGDNRFGPSPKALTRSSMAPITF